MKNILTQIVQEGIFFLHQKGYEYQKKTVIPAIEKVTKSNLDDQLLAEIYCLIGDLHEFNGAPLQAMQAYQKASSFDSTWATPDQEMANVLAQVGRYFEAFQYINLAIEKDPNDADLIAEKQEHQDNMNYEVEPLYTTENEIWKVCEQLAQEQFKEVITSILNKKTEDIDWLKCLNRAYGALGKVDLYWDNYEKMKRLDEGLELEDGDWFYMPREVYDSEEMVLLRKASLDDEEE